MSRIEDGVVEGPLTALVTGVGAIIGQGIIKSLRAINRDIRIIGIDRNTEGLGPSLCDSFYAKPRCEESSIEYLRFWQSLILKEAVDIVLPGLEVDVQFLVENCAAVEESGTKIVLNNRLLIEQSADKWTFGQLLAENGFPRIPATLARSWHACQEELGPGPFLLKPRRGNGSRGIVKIESEADFSYWTHKVDKNFLIQKFLDNDDMEFTVGAFGLGNGETLPPIIFRRKLSVAGNTQFAEVVTNTQLRDEVNRLAKHFKPLGPTNYQFRFDHEIPYLLEINPRFSSSTSLRAAFGYNEAKLSIEFYLDASTPELPTVVAGRGWRYYEDYVVT
ncbi:ATP-grasp domain-containing protein [Pseudomonas sp. ML96]|uniref:ATP-grasp domain-containing protein n=1 Tax=Pseudomonas sp. ML96 TaxID=1523503 RepID=UPI0009DEE047|nr:ATP-grasp domain-containing protein [Pseudomonas sp. ML96]